MSDKEKNKVFVRYRSDNYEKSEDRVFGTEVEDAVISTD